MNASLFRQRIVAIFALATVVAVSQGVWLAKIGRSAPPTPSTAAAEHSEDSPDAPEAPAAPPASTPAEHPATGAEIYQTLLKSTAFIVVEETDSSGPYMATGSGWIVDRKRKLVVTNHHVVGQARTAKVYFPVRESNGDEDRLVSERERYLAEFTPFIGKVFLNDSRRDLAVIKLDRLPEECQEIPLAGDNPSPGEPVYSVGNPGASEALFVFASGTVRQAYHRKMTYDNGQEVDAEIVESQSPVNPGDSGGPVVNAEGKVIGVVASSQTEAQLFNYFISVREVKTLMREADELWAPKTAEQYYRRGMQYYHRADYKPALENFEAAIRLDPKYADAIAQRGCCYYRDNDLQTAEADFEEAAAINPKCLEARIGLATIELNREQWPQAVEQATEAIRIDSDDPRGYMLRGKAYYSQKQYELARADLQDAQRLQGGAEAALYLGRASYALGRAGDAAEAYLEAIKSDPGLVDAFLELAGIFLDLGAMKSEFYEYAINLADLAIEKNQGNNVALEVAYYLRAVVHRKQNLLGKAIDDLDWAASYSTSPQDSAYIYDIRGAIYQDLRQYENAEQDFRLAIRFEPQAARYRLDLARLEFARGNLIEADESCDKAAELSPDDAGYVNWRTDDWFEVLYFE